MPRRPPPELPTKADHFNPLIQSMKRRGWPLTKAAYLYAMTEGTPPEFPLDAEVIAEASEASHLPGKLPRTPEEYWAVVDTLPHSKPGAPGQD